MLHTSILFPPVSLLLLRHTNPRNTNLVFVIYTTQLHRAAVCLLGEMGVSVEDEGCSVGVSAHVLPHQPVSDIAARKLGILQST